MRTLSAAAWKRILDRHEPEEQAVQPSQPKAPVPNHLVKVTAQGTRLMSNGGH